MKKNAVIFLIGLFTVLVSFSSCNRKGKFESMNENFLFSMSYGNFAEQISPDDFNHTGSVRYGVAMQDGFFYIVDGCSNKIMEMNSYGDMLTLFYNENSDLAKLISKSEQTDENFLWEISYPFTFNGLIAVDSSKTIYAVCDLPVERYEKNENGQLCSQVIMRMTRDGSSIGYIGLQGNGGSPYPYIRNIFITKTDELVVVCNTMDGLCVYWYAKEGYLKNTIPVSRNSVPLIKPPFIGSDIYYTLDNIIPDPSNNKIYLKVDYYNSSVDEDSRIQTGIGYTQTLLYPMDCDTGVLEEAISIPAYEESIVVDYSKITYKIPYDFFGVTPSGWKYFIIKTADGFAMELVQSESQKLIKRNFKIDHNKTVYFDMYLSSDGIITALIMDKDSPKIVWYRTDSIIDNIIQK